MFVRIHRKTHVSESAAKCFLMWVISGPFQVFQVTVAQCRLFWLVTASSRSFCFLQATTSQYMLAFKFSKTKTHVRFYYKVGQSVLQTGAGLMHCKVGQVVLQIATTFLYYKTGPLVLQDRSRQTGNVQDFF